jgi:hypothetical protein
MVEFMDVKEPPPYSSGGSASSGGRPARRYNPATGTLE